jgi:hypothetical protein
MMERVVRACIMHDGLLIGGYYGGIKTNFRTKTKGIKEWMETGVYSRQMYIVFHAH